MLDRLFDHESRSICCAVVGRALYMMLRYCSELLSSTALQKAEPAVPDRLLDSRLRYSMDEFAQRAVARAMAPSSEIWLRARSSRVSLVECFRNSAIRIASTSVYSSLSHSSSSSSRSSPTGSSCCENLITESAAFSHTIGANLRACAVERLTALRSSSPPLARAVASIPGGRSPTGSSGIEGTSPGGSSGISADARSDCCPSRLASRSSASSPSIPPSIDSTPPLSRSTSASAASLPSPSISWRSTSLTSSSSGSCSRCLPAARPASGASGAAGSLRLDMLLRPR
mmetsp:Transcript_28512/g.94703  ORF Transcript_28512/g.94703 Transcript_28512/m.94703 type:complete len:286 (+) Transcript_28512:187-1044(+)